MNDRRRRTRVGFGAAVAGVLALVSGPGSLIAQDVTLEYQTRMEFAGIMGQMLRMMPGMGDAMAPRTTTTRISGTRLRTDDGSESSMIVDADAGHFIQIDHEERTFMVMTPGDMGRMAEETRERMEAAVDSIERSQPDQPQRPEGEGQLNVEARVDTERTGRRESVAGLDAEEWYLTLQADFEVEEEEGANPMFVGSTVSFSDIWLSDAVPGGEEQARIWAAFGEEMAETFDGEETMEGVYAVNPQFRVMFEQNREAMEAMQGTAVRTTTLMILVPPNVRFEQERAVADLTGELSTPLGALAGAAAGEAARGAAAEAARGALGRLGGGLFGRNREPEPEPEEVAPPAQSTLLRMVEELQRVSRDPIPASVFEIPEGYREIDLEALLRGQG